MSKLKTEINTPQMDDRIARAFAATRIRRGASGFRTDFEHGQWWVTVLDTGAQYSVVDAEEGDSIDGFDFERVTAPDEE